MCYHINSDLCDRINLNRFEILLKEHHIRPLGSKKKEVFKTIENAINGMIEVKSLTVDILDEFIANEIKYGKNRNLYISRLDKSSADRMQNIELVQHALRDNGFRDNQFNQLRTINCPKELELAYLNFQCEEGKLLNISMCFSNTCKIINEINEYTNFIWVDISPFQNKITVRLWIKANSHLEAQTSAIKLHNDVLGILKNVFKIRTVNTDTIKGTLYKMYKNLTDIASKPFKDPLNLIQDNIDQFVENCIETLASSELNIKNKKYPVNLPCRIGKLFERAMIQEHFDIYERHFEGKRGFVKKFNFSDSTGANVNAKAAMNKSLELADVYFDTRETLDDIKFMNKLWVVLYYCPHVNTEIEKIDVKIEAFSNYFVIHILNLYLTKEVDDVVLSNFKYFEMLPNRPNYNQ